MSLPPINTQALTDFLVRLLNTPSHNYERTHTDSLTATTNWILAYLLSE